MIVAGVFATLIAWSLSANLSISVVNAQVGMMNNSLRNNQQIAHRYTALQDLVDQLQEKSNLIERLDTGVKISAALGEISFLVGEKITLTDFACNGEEFKPEMTMPASSVRLGKMHSAKKGSLPSENLRFKLVLKGTAENAADVTAFITRLEKSGYLCQVVLGFLKNVKDTAAADFEVRCYVANYIIEEV